MYMITSSLQKIKKRINDKSYISVYSVTARRVQSRGEGTLKMGENVKFFENRRKFQINFLLNLENFRWIFSKFGGFQTDFLSNLEKILVVLSPEIGESCHQKAEGGIPPHPPRSHRRCIYEFHNIQYLFNYLCLSFANILNIDEDIC